MTSISPALPRPPPPLGVHPGLHRTHSRPGSQLPKAQVDREKQTLQQNDVEFVQDRPAKRRKVSSSSLDTSSSLISNDSATTQSRYKGVPWSTVVRVQAEVQADRASDTTLPPLPERPWAISASKEITLQDVRPTVRVRKNVAVPNTPDCMDTPSDAPLYEQKRRADYFPWMGKHPEDVLNQSTVRDGYHDHAPAPADKELNTAKAPLYNAFKHRSGLDNLSALFSLVLDAKSKHGAFSSRSTFKGPPPRVTLTEVKRKSWISDLANPDVPLRKLSKTIPQGIRGPLLLEQCLQNKIPLNRAIWFTKCVGANEIRTLKRKGVNPVISQGAEIKWLREWTTSIEQFIESILDQCGQPNWKDKIRYSIMFAARLYLENLVDRDHYLDWILKSLSAANANHWPFWLMVVHMHRMDLVAFRKKGKQLAETLVLKYNSARSSPADTLQPLVQSFAAAIRPLVTAKPNCFLMPDRWNECQQALESCLSSGDHTERQILERLKFLNARASGTMNQAGLTRVSPLERVVDILDSYRAGVSVPELYESLSKACPDQELLASKCLEWCVSKYRSGKTRIYLAARLLRKLRKQGCDVDQILLNFIFNRDLNTVTDDSALRHLTSELSRSNNFPVSKYMQWLSVRGLPRPGSIQQFAISDETGLSTETNMLRESKDTQQLLTELCLLHVDDHLVNLRNSLLNRAGFDEDTESNVFESLRRAINHDIANNHHTKSNSVYIRLGRAPWTPKTKLSYWLRTEMIALAKASQTEIPGKPPLPGAKSLTLERFQIVRDCLEQAGDIAILADVLRITSSSRQEDILAAAVDSINMHCSTLAAVGALEPLQMLYGQTYVMLRSIKPAMPLFASALINLCQQYPIKTAPVKALQQDLIRGDRGRAVTACSPFSDGVAESLQQAGATFHDDFEALLQTESNMNDQTMIRLFKVLIDRIEKTQYASDSAHELVVSCQLLARLKLCQKSQGELLLKKWVAKLCGNQSQPMSSQLLFSLVFTRCVSLELVMEICQQLPLTSTSRLRLHAHIKRAILEEDEDDIGESLKYSFRLGVSKLVSTRPVDLLDIVGTDETGKCSMTSTKPLLIAAVLSNPELIKTLSKPAWLVVSQTLSEYLDGVNSSDPPEVQARGLASSAGPLSLPFCSLRMRMLCQNVATKTDEGIQDQIATTLCTIMMDPQSTLSDSPRTFQTLLRATGPLISAKVRSSAELSFLNALPRFLQTKGLVQPPLPTQEETEHAAKALQQVFLVNTDVAGVSQSSSITGLIEKLTVYMKTLGPSSSANQQSSLVSPITTTAPAFSFGDDLNNFLVATMDHLVFLLQMLCMKRPALGASLSQAAPNATKPLQQDQIKLVGLLITIGTHPTWSSVLSSLNDREQSDKVRSTLGFAFDVAATLVDDMSDESRMFCARILKEKVKDERVQWLLGSVNSFGSLQSREAGHGYQVVHESKGILGEWKPKMWEMLESGASGDSCLGLGLFGARRA